MKQLTLIYQTNKRNILKFNKAFEVNTPEEEAENLNAFSIMAKSKINYKIVGSGLFCQHHDPLGYLGKC